MTDWNNVKVASPYDNTPDASVATKEELDHIIETGNVPHTVPQTQRFNPSLPYADMGFIMDDRDKILLKAIKRAIENGWEGWRTRVNDATTVGMEAEQLVKEMKSRKASVKDLLFDIDFASRLWPLNYKGHLQRMVLADDIMIYMRDNLQ